MTDLIALIDLIQRIGSNPLLVVILTAILIKRYLVNGSGSFFRTSVNSWLNSQQERIAVDVKINTALEELEEKYQSIQEALWEDRRLQEDRLKRYETALTEHAHETHALWDLLQKSTKQNEGGIYGL